MKQIFLYIIIFLTFIATYFISNWVISKQFVTKEITYSSGTAYEVYMAWGRLDGNIPFNDQWPPNSYFKDGLVFTKMTAVKDTFFTSIMFPSGTEIYYWMVQRKDKDGNETDIWDTGGASKEFYRLAFTYEGIFNPGYFIFLAGFIPLLLLYSRSKNRTVHLPGTPKFRIKEYIPQFDSIRAIAVILVILHH